MTTTVLFSFVIGVLIVALIVALFGRYLLSLPNKRFAKIKEFTVFSKPLLCGSLVFLFNALMMGTVIALVFLNIFLSANVHFAIPVPLFGPLAVGISIFGWIWIGRAWRGSQSKRLLSALTGSSFYLLLTLYAIIRMTTLKPAFDGDDMFMAWIGLLMLLVVSATAAVTCFLIIGWPRRRLPDVPQV